MEPICDRMVSAVRTYDLGAGQRREDVLGDVIERRQARDLRSSDLEVKS